MTNDHHPSPFARVLRLLAEEKRDLWVVFVYAVTIGILSLAAPLTAMAVVNSVALATLVQQLVVMTLVLLAALTLSAVLQGMQAVVVEYIQRRVFVRVAADLADGLPRVDVAAFDARHGPELVNRFFDVLTVQKAAATLLLDGVAVVLRTVIGLVLLGFYDPLLLGFDVVLVVGLVFLVVVLGRGAVRTAIAESVAKYAVAGWVEEVARHPAAFKGGGGPAYAAGRTHALILDYLSTRAAHFRRVLGQFAFGLGLQVFANSALLAIGGYLVMTEKLSLGQLVAAEIVVTLVVSSFSKLIKQFESYYDLLAAADKLGYLTDLPRERAGGDPLPAAAGGLAVAVNAVTFAYPESPRPALSGVSFAVAPGERLAVVGPNGCGKTTLSDLLFGLRTPAAGWVELDGRDVRSLALPSLREQVAVVKGLEVFAGTVTENVRVGRPHVTPEAVKRALVTVGLWDAVMARKDGLDTQLTPAGGPFSLGQAVRLMLARAIAGNPRLLILDETLDQLDDAARDHVLPAVTAADPARTLIVITHRADVAGLCDRVLTLGAPGS